MKRGDFGTLYLCPFVLFVLEANSVSDRLLAIDTIGDL